MDKTERLKATRDALVQARDFLASNQWTKHKNARYLEDGSYSFCARGALKYGPFRGFQPTVDEEGRIIQRDTVVYAEAIAELDKAASLKVGDRTIIEYYNDVYATFKEDVLDVFTMAIESIEERLNDQSAVQGRPDQSPGGEDCGSHF